jgi:polyisoprenoid-binding protein YceI
MKIIQLSVLAVGLLASAPFAPAQSTTWSIDSNHSQATFVVKHMLVTNVRGSISSTKGTVNWDPKDPGKSSVEAVLETATLDTQSAYRDKDLKGADFFNVEKFPTLTFKSTSVKRVGNGLKIYGDLTLAGVTKPVVLDATEPSAPQKNPNPQVGGVLSGLEATTSIKRTDFNFAAKYPNAVVGDDIQITIDVDMDQN